MGELTSKWVAQKDELQREIQKEKEVNAEYCRMRHEALAIREAEQKKKATGAASEEYSG